MRENERHTMKCQRDYGRHAGLADRLDWNILTSFVFGPALHSPFIVSHL